MEYTMIDAVTGKAHRQGQSNRTSAEAGEMPPPRPGDQPFCALPLIDAIVWDGPIVDKTAGRSVLVADFTERGSKIVLFQRSDRRRKPGIEIAVYA